MRRLGWISIACAGCASASATKGSALPPAADPPPVSDARDAPGGAGFAPDEIWIRRALTIGPARPEAELVVSTLGYDGAHAALSVETRRAPFAPGGVDAAALPWQTESTRRYEGAVAAGPRGVTLRLTDVASHEPLAIACTRVTRAVAPPTAMRVRDPSFHGECGNRGVWSAPATAKLELLECATGGEPDVYARAPGVETLGISGDCWMQGKGERAIADDGAIAPTGATTK